jgi:hypothetical protein
VTVEEAAVGFSELTARWQERGASEIIVHDVGAGDLGALLALAG